MLFQPRQKILCIGDSITDGDRRGSSAPLGNGYVNLLRCLIQARYPEIALRFVNKGASGDTVRDLATRWERDVLAERPDWVSVMIGINDVWRLFSNMPYEAVLLPEYTRTLHKLLQEARNRAGARLIVMEPFMIEGDLSSPMRRQVDRYRAAAHDAAAHVDAILVPTQQVFDTLLEHTLPTQWSSDSIHPNGPGHAVIALAWLRAVGLGLD